MTSIVDSPDFGQYQLLARLGERARGPAYVARVGDDLAADPLFVIELSGFTSDEDELARAFVRDIDAAAQIRHRNVAAIVARGENTAGRYVATEYVEGATLAELEDRHRAIRPPRLVVAAAIDALHGLEAARTQGAAPVIHGSLSADHLLLGLDGACRIFGFGAVRPRVQTRPSLRSRAGTATLAPEQLTGGEVDHRSDLFSLAVVLWNALTGKKLFHDRLEHATMTNVLERKVPRPSAIGLSPPPAFDAVVLKALERDPARRFHSAGEMAEALREVARAVACLAATTEVAEWITTTFGSDLQTRRRAIREIAARAAPPIADLPVLPPLGALGESARDELSTDDIARASEPPPPRAPTVVPALAPIALPTAFPGRSARRQLAIVAVSAFAVVVAVLGWRWSMVARAPDPVVAIAPAAPVRPPPILALEVTVLEVRTIAAPVPDATAAAAPPAPPTAPAPAPVTAAKTVAPEPVAAPRRNEPARPEPARPDTRPARKVVRPGAPRPADARGEPDKPPEPRAEPPRPESPRPEVPRPALESNPYLYK